MTPKMNVGTTTSGVVEDNRGGINSVSAGDEDQQDEKGLRLPPLLFKRYSKLPNHPGGVGLFNHDGEWLLLSAIMTRDNAEFGHEETTSY
jgi:hypothetical protein